MGHVRETIHIDATLEAVWALATNATRIPEWQANVLEVKGVSGTMDRVGAKYTSVARLVGRSMDSTFSVTKVDKPRMIEISGTVAGGGHGTGTIRLDSTGTGTEYTMEFDYELPGGILGGVVDRVFAERTLERDVRHSLETFKALCEAEAKVPA